MKVQFLNTLLQQGELPEKNNMNQGLRKQTSYTCQGVKIED